jgi:hypothetical protein
VDTEKTLGLAPERICFVEFIFMVIQILQSSVVMNMKFMFLWLFVFTGEALHLGHLMAAHGYFFPIDDHMLTVKNDNTFYRFQVSTYSHRIFLFV